MDFAGDGGILLLGDDNAIDFGLTEFRRIGRGTSKSARSRLTIKEITARNILYRRLLTRNAATSMIKWIIVKWRSQYLLD
jgi:hypothetical protein